MEIEKGLMEKMYNALVELGLQETEINLYVTSLRLGPCTLTEVANHLNIARPNVYKLIQRLEECGLVAFSKRQKYTRHFIVESPTILLQKLREKRERTAQLDHSLVGIMPDLLALYHQGSTLTKIKVLQGREQFVKLFNQMLEESRDGGEFFGSAEDFIQFITWDVEQVWINRRIEKDLSIKVLLLPSETAKTLKSKDNVELRETRVLQNMQPFVTAFQLFANKVIIWQPEAPLALLIEDQYIVTMLRSIFYNLWERSGV